MATSTITVIRPQSGWFRLKLRPVWDYRDLLFLLVRRDFVSRFKQTILGPAWFFVSPIATTLVFTVVFGRVANLSTDGLPQPLFYNAGLLAWTHFSTVLTATAGTFLHNSGMFGKVYFPRLVVPLANSVSALIALAIQFLSFIGFYVAYKFGPAADTFSASPWAIVGIPLVVLQISMIGLGFGFMLCALTTRYRDFAHIIGFLVQLLMYATPVIYPLSKVPEDWRWLAVANPVTATIESTRFLLLGTGSVSPGMLAGSILATLAIFITGVLLFQRAERTFIDTV